MMIIRSTSALALALVALSHAQAAGAQEHAFTADSKGATEFTAQANKAVLDELDFDDRTSFEDVDRGFIAPLLNDGVIEGSFDASGYNFMQDREAPDTVNPSLWRHAQLVNRGGLYEVLPDKIYQVRGQDLVNLTIIETDNGIVLYDVEYSPPTLKASIELYEQERGKKDLKGVIISHSHADHFGGFAGIYDAGLTTPEDVASGAMPVYAPEHFVEESVSENVMFGNVMARRAGYQYGNVLDYSETGALTASLGAALSSGNSGLPIPNNFITEDGQKVTIDGVDFEFYLTPDAEAPAEMIFWIDEWKALSMAEEMNHLQHNLYTLRGSQTRDARVWSKYIGDALARWGNEVEVNFGPHTWPVWGNDRVAEYLKDQRDLYKSLYDTTVRYANYGYRPDDIAQNAELPETVFKRWTNRPYYGHTVNNLKSTYIRNLGWFSGNAAELARYADAERGQKYVEALGGEEAVVAAAAEAFEVGDYRFASDLLNNIVSYTAENQNANYLMADALEQLGYQEENSLYRNLYLSGAKELRSGGSVPNDLSTSSPEVIAGLPTDNFIQFMTAMVDQPKAEGVGNHVFDLTLDDGAQYSLDLHNGVLNYVADHKASDTSATIETTKADFLSFVSGAKTLDELKVGGMKVTGDEEAVAALGTIFVSGIRGDMNLVLPLQEANRIPD